MNPYYGYSAYPGQQRMASLDQQRMVPPQPLGMGQPMFAPGLKGRMVMGVEEARAAQIDFDGSVSYFPCPAENKIYSKSTDLNGMPVFLTYVLQEPVPAADGLADIKTRLAKIEDVLKELGYDEPNAAGSNAPAK